MASTPKFPTNHWKETSWIKPTSIILLLLLAFAQGKTSNSRRVSLQQCYRKGEIRHGHIFKKPKNAGTFSFLEKTNSVEECVDLCCRERFCQVALFLKSVGQDKETSHAIKLKGSCYAVKCNNARNSCDTIPVRNGTHLLSSIFIRNSGIENPASLQQGETASSDSDKTLIREKRHESCHHYHGRVCSSYLEKGRLLYFNKYPPSVEKALTIPFRKISNNLSKDCMKYALPAICVTAFPSCSKKSKPKPDYLCRKDCENLYSGVCVADFKLVNSSQVLAKILPDCDKLPITGSPDDETCVKIGVPDPVDDLDNDKKLMKGATPSEDNEEETGDVGGVPQVLALNPLKGTATSPVSSPFRPLTSPNVTVSRQTLQTGAVSGEMTPTGSNSVVKEENTPGLPASGQSIQTPQALELNNRKSGVVSDKADISSEESDLASPIKQLGDDKSPKGRTSNTKPDLNQNFGLQQSDTSSEDKDSKSRTDGGLTGSATNNSKHLQESLGMLDPSEPTAGPNTSHSSLITGAQTRNTETASTLASSPQAYTGDKETVKEKKNLPEPTASSLSTSSPMTTKLVLSSPSPSPNTLKRSSTRPMSSERPSLPPINGSKPTVKPSQSQRTLSLPSLVLVNSSKTETNFAQSSENLNVTSQPNKDLSTTESSAPTTTSPPLPLHVSAGSNKEIVLPANTVSLYASAWPKEMPGNPYSYHWQQISAPHGSHGYMQGQETKQVTLTQLDKPGVYQFKVKVTGSKRAIGFAYVNVTVKPVPRVNKPPRADITPREQTITLPTNEVVLDGRKSSDDDKITQYKWEEVKGPLNDKNKVISSGSDSPILQLKSLVPGVYTFKLTVVDSDGATDSTTATVTVNNEKDYPPVARAGHDVVLTLPVNSVTLNGSSSMDDKGIASYEWSKSSTSPAVGDMQGTTTAFLKVSNLVVGDYTFILKVTDTRGQSDTTKVTVVVQPEKNEPPVAKAGSDKDLVFPDDTTTLDAKDSKDDQKIVKYQWEQIQGPAQAEMVGANSRVVTLKKLQEGHYLFKLTVTDQKGLTGQDTVAVNVKKDINKPPVAKAGPDVVVHLPNRATELDGSQSTDDQGVAMYLWTRDPKSPAAGDVINNSDHQSVLRLSNLVEGMYKFKLTVADNKGLKSDDEAIITVKEDEHSAHLVELYLDVDITRFTEENKEQLIRKLAVILNVEDQAIIVEHIKEAGTGHSVVVMFYVKEKETKDPRDGQDVAEVLKEKIENEEGFFEFRMLKVDPYICRNNCSGHGYCDRRTKLCVCESFWMQDIFKASFGAKESNCDWSILYVTVIIFGIIMGVGGIIWGICFCMGRYRSRKVLSVQAPALVETSLSCQNGRRNWRGKRRHRYAIIDGEDDDDKAESMEMLPKGKYFNSSMMFTDSDEDSDEETTLFEAKKRIMNGHSTSNGFIGRKDT